MLLWELLSCYYKTKEWAPRIEAVGIYYEYVGPHSYSDSKEIVTIIRASSDSNDLIMYFTRDHKIILNWVNSYVTIRHDRAVNLSGFDLRWPTDQLEGGPTEIFWDHGL